MSEFKHTPGPWEVFDPRSDNQNYGIDGSDKTAVVYYGSTLDEGIRSIHDARLIAAAPDLLEALQAALSQCLAWQGEPNEHSCEIHSEIVRQARAAIAKATGE